MSLGETLVSVVATKIIDGLKSDARSDRSRDATTRIEAAIADHLREVTNWTRQFQPLDASSPRDLESATIHIGFDTEPRRFSRETTARTTKGEADLLVGREHYLLLGNPGSGKTTAVKRITQRLLTEPPASTSDQLQFPLVIRLRELRRGEPLHCKIASVLGLEYETVELVGTVGGVTVTRTEVRVAGQAIERVVSRVLSSIMPLVLLDGLDEVWPDTRGDIAREISLLAHGLNGGKVIATSRTGDYTVPLDGFNSLQLCPLTKEQIQEIALKWLPDSAPFINALDRLPYRDVADRPLLLTQLVILFKRYGFLPEQPAQVYKRVIRILLEDWDAQRQIVRPSRYAGFDPDRKSEFLAAIAFHLTYTVARSQFSESDLVDAYRRVHEHFNLPVSEAVDVAREVEAHTGIIVATGHDSYEFSHLSIQEYLCASYLVRSASPMLVRRALAGNTSPVAVAVALSSQPSEWLARLILNPDHHSWLERAGVVPFLTRLLIEQPFFEVFEPLGWAAMHLCHRLYRSDARLPEIVVQFLQVPGVRRSVAESLRWYVIGVVKQSGPVVLLKSRTSVMDAYEIPRPNDVAVPRAVLEEIVRNHPQTVIWIQNAGKQRESTLQAALGG